MKNLLLLSFLIFLSSILFSQKNVWLPTNGPFGGNVIDLKINSRGILFCACDNYGIFRSTDNGNNWNSVFQIDATTFYIDPSDNIFVAVKDSGLYRSSDNGGNWVNVNSGQIDIVAITNNRRGDLLLGTLMDGIFISKDNCNTWEQIRIPESEYLSSLIVDKNDRIYTATDNVRGGNAIYVSNDEGITWNQIKASDECITALAISPKGYIYAGIDGLYCSKDAGKIWKRIDQGFASYLIGCVVFDSMGNLFVGTGQNGIKNGLYYSNDDGKSWSEIKTGLTNAPIVSIIVANKSIFVGAGDGIKISIDQGKKWYRSIKGINSLSITALTEGLNGEIYAGAEYGRVFRSTDDGKSWRETNIAVSEGTVNTLTVDYDGTVYASTQQGPRIGSGNVYRSTDHGLSWIQTKLTECDVASIVVVDSNRVIAKLFGDHFGVSLFYETKDHGITWNRFYTMLDNQPINKVITESFNSIYALSAYLPNEKQCMLYKSTDGGLSWKQISTFPFDASALSIRENVYCVSSNWSGEVSISNDYGKNWSNHKIDKGAFCFSLLVENKSTIIAGCGNGIYESENNGNTWRIKSKFEFTRILCKSLRNIVFAATSSGIYKLLR